MVDRQTDGDVGTLYAAHRARLETSALRSTLAISLSFPGNLLFVLLWADLIHIHAGSTNHTEENWHRSPSPTLF